VLEVALVARHAERGLAIQTMFDQTQQCGAEDEMS
jgi:hypothetical protein